MHRIQEIDSMRGFALFGVLLVNIFVFHAPLCYYGEFYGAMEGIEAAIVNAVVVLASGKFLFIFAFLFGYGISLQWTLLGPMFYSVFAKRMMILFLFGGAHIVLFWFGDILATYALLGIIIIPLMRMSSGWMLFFGAFFLLFRPFYYLGALYLDWPLIPPEQPVSLEEFKSIFQNGSFLEILQLRMKELIAFIPENLVWFIPKTFGLFFIGIYAARKEFFTKLKKQMKNFILWFVMFFLISMSWNYYKNDVFALIDLSEDPEWRPILIGINVIVEFCQGMAYIIGLGIIFQRNNFISEIFARTGRLALTNYILQSLLCVFIFYGFGLGYYSTLLPSDLVLIAVCIFGFNLFGSYWYLQYKSIGPLEYIWRKWTRIN